MGATAKGPRDLNTERVFLAAAEDGSASTEFVEHARRRLERGEERFGQRWTGLTLREFLRELQEEAADLGAWAALAVQHLEHVYTLDKQQQHEIRGHLAVIAHFGACAHRETERMTLALRGRRA